MKKIINSLLVISMMGASSVFALYYPDSFMEDLEIRGSAGFESEYVYRGSKLAQGSMMQSVEASYPAFCGKAYAGVWSVHPIAEKELCVGAHVNPYIGASFDITDLFTIDAGFIYYWYTHKEGPVGNFDFLTHNTARQREVYGGISADVILNPSIYVFYNFDLKQWVIEPSISYSFDMACLGLCGFSLDTNGHFGWLHADQFNGNQRLPNVAAHVNSYWYLGLKGDVVYHFSECASIFVGVRGSYNTDKNLATFNASGPYTANALGGHDSLFWWGTGVNFSF